ncbi:hypothetical protein [Glutamicibacter arilaitensis]|uniref:hypothetical protein n=1 Tax=Glutamicibacter arilaitensis TaxID=256701 RepID=UPI00384A5291
MAPVDVVFTPASRSAFGVAAGSGILVSEPTKWFERTRWWEDTTFRIPKNTDVQIDYVVWRVQVRLGHNPRCELITWDLIENPQTEIWAVRENLEEQVAP